MSKVRRRELWQARDNHAGVTSTRYQHFGGMLRMLPGIRPGAIGGSEDADTHSLVNPVGEVAGATNPRTPPLACTGGGVAQSGRASGKPALSDDRGERFR